MQGRSVGIILLLAYRLSVSVAMCHFILNNIAYLDRLSRTMYNLQFQNVHYEFLYNVPFLCCPSEF